MKISVEDITGQDREKAALCLRAIVTLDGKKVEHCIIADEEGGYVVAYIPKENPRWETEFKDVDYWPTETKRGEVRIIDPDAKL